MSWISDFWKIVWDAFTRANQAELKPVPKPDPVVPPKVETIIVLDLDKQPQEMRDAGIPGRDTALWYVANCKLYPGWDWPESEAMSDSDGVVLWGKQAEVIKWLDDRVIGVVKRLNQNSLATAIIIVNDGPDKCGNRVGKAITEKMIELKAPMDRVNMGIILPEPTS